MIKEGTISYRFSDKTLLYAEGRGARVVIGDSRRVFMGVRGYTEGAKRY